MRIGTRLTGPGSMSCSKTIKVLHGNEDSTWHMTPKLAPSGKCCMLCAYRCWQLPVSTS